MVDALPGAARARRVRDAAGPVGTGRTADGRPWSMPYPGEASNEGGLGTEQDPVGTEWLACGLPPARLKGGGATGEAPCFTWNRQRAACSECGRRADAPGRPAGPIRQSGSATHTDHEPDAAGRRTGWRLADTVSTGWRGCSKTRSRLSPQRCWAAPAIGRGRLARRRRNRVRPPARSRRSRVLDMGIPLWSGQLLRR